MSQLPSADVELGPGGGAGKTEEPGAEPNETSQDVEIRSPEKEKLAGMERPRSRLRKKRKENCRVRTK